MRKVINILLIVSLFVILSCSGCCTVMSGTTQDIPVYSNPAGAKIDVIQIKYKGFWKSKREEIIISTVVTPETLVLKRGKSWKLVGRCDGYNSQSLELTRKFNEWRWANLLIDFGIITGTVDTISGAGFKFEPKTVYFDFCKEYRKSND